jgi:hypothetical protein
LLSCPLFGILSSEQFGTLRAIASTARRGVTTVAVDESETTGFERGAARLDLSFSEADCTGWSENQARSGMGAIGF